MDLQQWLSLATALLTLLLGALSAWLRGNQRIAARAASLIAQAEEEYRDVSKAGGEKFAWVVDHLYQVLPAAIRPFVPRPMVESLVQATFDAVEGYAALQLDELTKGDPHERN